MKRNGILHTALFPGVIFFSNELLAGFNLISYFFTAKFINGFMKKLSLFASLLAILVFAACQNNNAGEAAATGDAQDAAATTQGAVSYAADTDVSVINWEGYKPGKYAHTGTIKLRSGQLAVNDGNIESGSFVIDMSSLSDLEVQDPKDKAKLEGHLKSGDFFEVEKYPAGKFEITNVQPLTGDGSGMTHSITGNLTLKDITKSVELPAKVAISNGVLTAKTMEFTINRTEWNISFNSGLLGAVGNALIADDVKLRINLLANVQAK